jgi:DNA-binding NarL/FixJ family response regulator
MSITILIADDHAVMRDGLQFLLASQEDFQVVSGAGDGVEAVEMACQHRPDVVLMDIAMPGMSGIDATHAIRQCSPATRVVILTMHATIEHIYAALVAGAQGYLVKESAGHQVLAAIRAVMAGERYFSKEIVTLITDAFLTLYHPATFPSPAVEALSPREREIVQLVIAGKTSKEIALLLRLSPKTVDTYRSRIMDKLGVHDLCSLTRKSLELGIAPQE